MSSRQFEFQLNELRLSSMKLALESYAETQNFRDIPESYSPQMFH